MSSLDASDKWTCLYYNFVKLHSICLKVLLKEIACSPCHDVIPRVSQLGVILVDQRQLLFFTVFVVPVVLSLPVSDDSRETRVFFFLFHC